MDTGINGLGRISEVPKLRLLASGSQGIVTLVWLQMLNLDGNALSSTIPWNWTLPDSLLVSMRLQGQRACLYAWGRGCSLHGFNLNMHRKPMLCLYSMHKNKHLRQ